MIIDFYLLVIFISTAASLISVSKKRKPLQTTDLLLIAVLLFVTQYETMGHYLAYKGTNNLFLYNICWVYLESTLLMLYFGLQEKNATTRKAIWCAYTLIIGYALVYTLGFTPLDERLHFIPLTLFALLLITLSVHFLTKVMRLKIHQNQSLLSIPHYWVAVGIIFFYLQAIFSFGVLAYYPDLSGDFQFIIQNFNRIVAGIMYLLFGISFFAPTLFAEKKSAINYYTAGQ